jgi:phosphoribosylformimino-5-aminoimidazole carboxamide ribotide isomerase
MRIIPVLDVQRGVVVRGVGGRRAEYRPIVSTITPSSEPSTMAEAFREHFGLEELYVADLDAIDGAAPAWSLFAALRERNFRLCVDAGVRIAADAEPLLAAGMDRVVLGLETLAGPEVVEELCRRFGPDRWIFSLDLKAGRPLGTASEEPAEIVGRIVAAGVCRVIVLDLAQVGSGAGVGTEPLMRRLLASHPSLEVIAGGGVRGVEDLLRLRAIGVAALLAASALHDGRLTREMVEKVAGTSL